MTLRKTDHIRYLSVYLENDDSDNIKILRANHIKVPSLVREFIAGVAAKYKGK